MCCFWILPFEEESLTLRLPNFVVPLFNMLFPFKGCCYGVCDGMLGTLSACLLARVCCVDLISETERNFLKDFIMNSKRTPVSDSESNN